VRRSILAVTLLTLGLAATIAPAQTFTTLVNFDGTNGTTPYYGPLVQATNGDLYGTTSLGGANNYGTIFKITPTGVLTTMHNFNLTDGAEPLFGLVQATNGDLYGTTGNGGANNWGAIYRITPAGIFTTIYSFGGSDGVDPTGLMQAANGNLYGTTGAGFGGIFKITPAGAFTILHDFQGADGYAPYARMIQGTTGELYGTTFLGGNQTACQNGCGTIFEISPSGAFTSLHSFNGTDGQMPNGLIQATDGNLYGSTQIGGANGYGAIFKITPSGTFTSLHSFDSTDGAYPFAGLMQATDGNLYGTTSQGGTSGQGTIFKFNSAGLKTVHIFGGTDGACPLASLLQETNGELYGTTCGGGTNNDGTIFRLSLGLAPFVKTLPTVGLVDSKVGILGTDLTGATGVTFNGTAAEFTVVRASEIIATVPTGATTGKVQVVTPKGTLTSNVAFEVAP
jgi:uncharacterized repeat protein (TIGR03803 family)